MVKFSFVEPSLTTITAESQPIMAPLGRQVLEHLLTHPSLKDALTWPQVKRFLDFGLQILPEIQGESSSLLLLLPPHVFSFLAQVLDLEQSLTQLCWTTFCDLIPMLQEDCTEESSRDDLFQVHGHDFAIGLLHLALFANTSDNHSEII